MDLGCVLFCLASLAFSTSVNIFEIHYFFRSSKVKKIDKLTEITNIVIIIFLEGRIKIAERPSFMFQSPRLI